MKYYSTNKQSPLASLHDAVIKGLAPDKGLYMPQTIPPMPTRFFEDIDQMSFPEIAYQVALQFFGEDVEHEALRHIVDDTLAFDTPLVHVTDRIYSLELFHGPTLCLLYTSDAADD